MRREISVGQVWVSPDTGNVWPEATDEELTAPGLAERLTARLPALLAAFRADVEALGFVW